MHSDFNFTVNHCVQAVQLLTETHSISGVHLIIFLGLSLARSDYPLCEGI